MRPGLAREESALGSGKRRGRGGRGGEQGKGSDGVFGGEGVEKEELRYEQGQLPRS